MGFRLYHDHGPLYSVHDLPAALPVLPYASVPPGVPAGAAAAQLYVLRQLFYPEHPALDKCGGFHGNGLGYPHLLRSYVSGAAVDHCKAFPQGKAPGRVFQAGMRRDGADGCESGSGDRSVLSNGLYAERKLSAQRAVRLHRLSVCRAAHGHPA